MAYCEHDTKRDDRKMGVTMQRIIKQIMTCILRPVGMLWYKTTKWTILVVALCVSLVWHVLYMFGTSGEYHPVWFNDSACTYQTVGGKLQINGVVLKHYRRHRAVNECVGEKSVHVMSINAKVVWCSSYVDETLVSPI